MKFNLNNKNVFTTSYPSGIGLGVPNFQASVKVKVSIGGRAQQKITGYRLKEKVR